jgi:regulator of protease activity HflC (stomatin/prohibitin superfamily)
MTTFQVMVAAAVALLTVLVVGRRLVARVVVYDYQRGVLYRRGRRIRTLQAGAYWLVRGVSSVAVVDARSRVAVVAGQEILSADSVPLRLSVTLRYRVARPETALEAAASFAETLHAETQLVLRDLVAATPAEELLPQRQRLAEGLQAALAPRALALGLELEEAGVRDVTFPAPLRQLFAQVVEARQAAQAALERARGETAVLRHLANTARLLEGNPALVTLRTLDAAAGARGTIVLGVPAAALSIAGAAADRPRAPETGGEGR